MITAVCSDLVGRCEIVLIEVQARSAIIQPYSKRYENPSSIERFSRCPVSKSG